MMSSLECRRTITRTSSAAKRRRPSRRRNVSPSRPAAPQSARRRAGGARAPRAERAALGEVLHLVDALAQGLWRKWRRHMELEDVAAEGRMALVEIVRQHDPRRAPFIPFVVPRLAWAMRDALRRQSHSRTVQGRRLLSVAEDSEASLFGGGHAEEPYLDDGCGDEASVPAPSVGAAPVWRASA